MTKKMTLVRLASLIAKREGKKHQASIGDIREILKIIMQLELENARRDPAITHLEILDGSPINCLAEACVALEQKKKPKK